MDTAARFALRYTETAAEAVSPPSPERERTLAVRATYLLSEDGRKASLLSGGNGCAVQEVSFTVPHEDLAAADLLRRQLVMLARVRKGFVVPGQLEDLDLFLEDFAVAHVVGVVVPANVDAEWIRLSWLSAATQTAQQAAT